MKDLKDMNCDEIFDGRYAKPQEDELIGEIKKRLKLYESKADVIAELENVMEELRNHEDVSWTNRGGGLVFSEIMTIMQSRITSLKQAQDGKEGGDE